MMCVVVVNKFVIKPETGEAIPGQTLGAQGLVDGDGGGDLRYWAGLCLVCRAA